MEFPLNSAYRCIHKISSIPMLILEYPNEVSLCYTWFYHGFLYHLDTIRYDLHYGTLFCLSWWQIPKIYFLSIQNGFFFFFFLIKSSLMHHKYRVFQNQGKSCWPCLVLFLLALPLFFLICKENMNKLLHSVHIHVHIITRMLYNSITISVPNRCLCEVIFFLQNNTRQDKTSHCVGQIRPERCPLVLKNFAFVLFLPNNSVYKGLGKVILLDPITQVKT